MAKIASQRISFVISKLVKGKSSSKEEHEGLSVIEQDHKDTIIELLEQTLGSEYIIEEE